MLQEVQAEGTAPWLAPLHTFAGNRPSYTSLLQLLTPAALGNPIALYEHSAFTQHVIWHIGSFGQRGIELRKVLAHRIIPELEAASEPEVKHGSSNTALIQRYREFTQMSP